MKSQALLISALTIAMASVSFVVSADDKADNGKEKCYGVSKAGKNDCASAAAKNSCAGSGVKDGDGFLVVPKGLCEKLIGGSLTDAVKK
jgi:uncharacterized membrane protein